MGGKDAVETYAGAGQLPRWVPLVRRVLRLSTTVAWHARKDLTDQRARRIVVGACLVSDVGVGLVEVLAARRAAHTAGEVTTAAGEVTPAADETVVAGMTHEERVADHTERRRDPETSARQRLCVLTVSAYCVTHQATAWVLPRVLRGRGVRRPHLITGLALAGVETAGGFAARRVVRSLLRAGPAEAPEEGRT